MTQQGLNKTEGLQAYNFLQGLGLLGLLLINAQTESLVTFLRPQPVYALPVAVAPSEPPMQFFLHLLVNGPFDGLLSVGLGWGFYRRWQAHQRAGLNAGRIASRGLWTLLGLGLLHGLVVGSGDWLHVYALLGFSLLYFVHQSPSRLLRWMAGLVGLGVLIQLLEFLLVLHWPPALAAPESSVGGLLRPLVDPGQDGSLREVLGWRPAGGLRGPTRAIGQGLTGYVYLEMLLLVGLILGKQGLVDRSSELRVRLSLLLVCIFPLAVVLKGVSSLSVIGSPLLPVRWQPYEPLLVSLGDFLGTPLLTGVYLLEMGLNRRPTPPRVAVWIGQAGRMSLTNYLLQSGFCRLVFDRYGLGQLSLLASVGVILLIYSLQLGLSHWWLGRYPQGPVEQILKRWTYRNRVAKSSDENT